MNYARLVYSKIRCTECRAYVPLENIDPKDGVPWFDDCGECGALLPHAQEAKRREKHQNVRDGMKAIFLFLVVAAMVWVFLWADSAHG